MPAIWVSSLLAALLPVEPANSCGKRDFMGSLRRCRNWELNCQSGFPDAFRNRRHGLTGCDSLPGRRNLRIEIT